MCPFMPRCLQNWLKLHPTRLKTENMLKNTLKAVKHEIWWCLFNSDLKIGTLMKFYIFKPIHMQSWLRCTWFLNIEFSVKTSRQNANDAGWKKTNAKFGLSTHTGWKYGLWKTHELSCVTGCRVSVCVFSSVVLMCWWLMLLYFTGWCVAGVRICKRVVGKDANKIHQEEKSAMCVVFALVCLCCCVNDDWRAWLCGCVNCLCVSGLACTCGRVCWFVIC